jgi:single-stranded DNA-binding protein
VAGPPTKLRVNAVKRLRKGRSVSVSGTLQTPPAIRDVTGGETVDYTLKVKRLR